MDIGLKLCQLSCTSYLLHRVQGLLQQVFGREGGALGKMSNFRILF